MYISDDQVNLYPNPIINGQNLRIELNGQFDKVYLLNSIQETIYAAPATSFVDIPIDNLPTGLYLILITNSEKLITKKLIIK